MDDLVELIEQALKAQRYKEAARLAAALDDVLAREAWFEVIGEAQATAHYLEEERVKYLDSWEWAA